MTTWDVKNSLSHLCSLPVEKWRIGVGGSGGMGQGQAPQHF